MKRSIPIKLISVLLTAVMLFTMCSVAASAADNSGKYLKDVFIAYGEEKSKAEEWLKSNGWEPSYDLNDGKTSHAAGFHNGVAVLGIKRTDDPTEAITDMAVMNMTGGYSFDDYEGLVKQKKADITEFIKTFVPALKEYRDNYNGKGSAGGKKRAQMAHDILNKFYDGKDNEYAVNDTGKPLGDLLLNETKTEIGDDAYNNLSADKKANTADLEQIILESSGPAVLIIEQTLALATDTAETSWLDRLNGLSGEALAENIEKYAPEAKGQDLAPSAAMNLLASHFEDYSKKLAKQWSGIREDILWYEKYCDDNELWSDNDNGGIDGTKVVDHFNALKEEDESRFNDEYNRFNFVDIYYDVLPNIDYSGAWGETLYDFFNPEDETADYSEKYSYFAPLAAALSDGQRAALEFLTLSSLLRLGADSDSVTEADFPSADEMFKDKDGNKLESISIYSGINRAIFRKGVALTSRALQEKNLGNNPYAKIWDEGGIADIVAYSTVTIGAISLVTGSIMYAKAAKDVVTFTELANKANEFGEDAEMIFGEIDRMEARENLADALSVKTAGKWLMGIGGALMIMAAVLKIVQIVKYYNPEFSQIPIMIVDEADITTKTTDEQGNEVITDIHFNPFAYYEVIKCNRQTIGLHTNAQKNVDKYKEWGCGDAADLNADIGSQWLAMYVNRSAKKGDPILADSLLLRTGKEEKEKGKEASEAAKKPDGYTGALHMFTYDNAQKLDSTDYCYRDDNEGMYLYWKGDANALTASATASAFNAGYLALAGVGGLGLGILGTTLVMFPKRKKKEEAAE